jgi:hypothetical protein
MFPLKIAGKLLLNDVDVWAWLVRLLLSWLIALILGANLALARLQLGLVVPHGFQAANALLQVRPVP